ncbi:MAG: putative LPS assembly protein LptD [Bacteroidales bacterium]|nr:putative LPS assembly protein LptD [Bacteroidales bacterium]
MRKTTFADSLARSRKFVTRKRSANVADTTMNAMDTTRSATPATRDSLVPLSPNAISEVIHYRATDSIALNLGDRQATLYKEGIIDYQNMELKANEIVVDFNRQTLKAKGEVDSAGLYQGRPYFKQGEAEYFADTILFNYNSKKGIINGVITQEGDGFLHGNKVKKVNDSVMFLNSGQYTTCNYTHPHFAFNFSKSKLITNKLIVTGPAYVSIQDVPTPLAVPFAFFPLLKGRSSGIILPSYGWMNGRGYYLKDGGYYFAINDNLDISLIAELYTNLSWKGEIKSNYYKRYKYRGSVDVSYGRYRQGLKEDTSRFKVFSDFKVSWQHSQDAKANPNSRFTANVNLQSRNYSKTTTNSNDYFNSTTTSSVSYNTKLGSAFNFSAALNESFNTQTGLMSLKLPNIALSSVTLYPFRNKNSSGNYKWFENVSMSYVLNGGNNLSIPDTDIFKKSMLNKMQYGVSHRIPVQSSVKVLRHFNWTNGLSYNERWHWSTIEKHIDDSTQRVYIDTIQGFKANRDFSFSSSLNTRIYGMFNFRFAHVKALRHVINPSVSFNFTPDFGNEKLGYWKSYTDSTGYVHRYSIFEQSLYGGPADGKSGRLSFVVGNSLEAKIKPFIQKDTGQDEETLKKVTLIENLSIAMSYDMARDSLNWSDLTINGRTTLFGSLVLNYSGSFIPYVVDSAGRKHNQLLWEAKKKLFQRSNSTWSAQLSYNINNKTFGGDEKGKGASRGEMTPPILQSPYAPNPGLLAGTYADFNVPWNFSFNYTLSYVSTFVAAQYNFKSNVVQTLGVSGNFSLTENWKISLTTGYDFENKGLSHTSIDIYRDLHCWEMRFNWVPFGYYKSWNFQINIKANSLKDVKWNKRRSYQDNEDYYLY